MDQCTADLESLPRLELISMITALQNALQRERNGQAFRDRVLAEIASPSPSKPLTGIKLTGRRPSQPHSGEIGGRG